MPFTLPHSSRPTVAYSLMVPELVLHLPLYERENLCLTTPYQTAVFHFSLDIKALTCFQTP
jgi:hypothetical protein